LGRGRLFRTPPHRRSTASLAFLRTVAAIGGWAPLLEINALRILPAAAESFVRTPV
jgi:hypothetical protein